MWYLVLTLGYSMLIMASLGMLWALIWIRIASYLHDDDLIEAETPLPDFVGMPGFALACERNAPVIDLERGQESRVRDIDRTG